MKDSNHNQFKGNSDKKKEEVKKKNNKITKNIFKGDIKNTDRNKNLKNKVKKTITTNIQENKDESKKITKIINKRLIDPNVILSEKSLNNQNSNRKKNSVNNNKNSKKEKNAPMKEKIIEDEKNNHQFYSSYFSNKNVDKRPRNSNSYTKYSNTISRKFLNDNNDNYSSLNSLRNRNRNDQLQRTFQNSFTPSRNYFPSSQTVNLRRRKLENGCFECPNCRFVFNPDEEYEKYYPIHTIEDKYNDSFNYNYETVKYNPIPFDTYSGRKTISTTIETKTRCSPPNVYTNERGTTIFTQPRRQVQVIRKSFGPDGEVIDTELKEGEEYINNSLNNNGVSRFSYENINEINNNPGYFDSYGERVVPVNQGYPYSEYY